MKDTYVSFTTHEARVAKIGPMLSSLLGQWPADRIILTVAHNLELPDFVEDSDIHIVRSADYGAFKKHSPLYMDLGVRQYIATDDDTIFPRGWFDNLLNWSHKLPGQVVCGRGRIWEARNTLHYPDSKIIYSEDVMEPVPCNIYVGVDTALFRTDFFEADVFPFPENTPTYSYSEDIWISAKLQDDVKIYVVPYNGEEHHETFGQPKALEYATEDTSLWEKAKANGYVGKDTALRNHRSKLLRRTYPRV